MIRSTARRVSRRLAAATCGLTLAATGLVPTVADAAPATPGWEALPAETVACIRMPNTRAFLETFRENTIAGQRLFTAERWDQIQALIQQESGGDWEQFQEALAEYGFTTEDLYKIAQSNWGAAFIADPRGDAELPRMIMLGWADLEDADIDRIYDAIDKANEENPTEDVRRTDLELEGVAVRQYSSAEMGMDREANWDTPDDFWEKTQEEQQAFWDEQQKINDAAEFTKVDETHLLLARVPGRMMVAVGVPQSKDKVRELIAAGQDIDWDAATDAASVQAVFARYLAAQDGGAEDSFAAKMLAQPEAADAVGHEHTLVEFYADGARVLNLIAVGIHADGGEEQARQYKDAVRSLGLDFIGVTAGSAYFADGALRYGAFVQMPNRAALPATLDGQTLPAAAPAWVPAGVTYAHLAYDLGKLYDVVVQTMQDLAGPEVMQQVQMGNMMVQSSTQADIRSILSSLGIRHSVMLLEGREITMESEEYDYESETFKTVERTSYFRPGALVWELGDANVWANVMAAIQNFVPSMAGPNSGVSVVDEQGFTGLRSDTGPIPGALMLGQGKLVLTFGPDVTARVLSLINNPPVGENALANSPLHREANQLMKLRDGIMFYIQDGGEDTVTSKRQFMAGLESGNTGIEPGLLEQIEQIIPSDDDLRASFGASVGQAYMTEAGFVLESAVATPAAE
ncbi:MAG: hypothetical protein AAF333_03715 [Planctomycetota bacterium]